MSRSFNGSSHRADYLSPATTSEPITMACWFMSSTATVGQCLMSLCDKDVGNRQARLIAAGDIAGDPIRAQSVFDGGNGIASTSSGYSADTWHHAAGVFASSTSRTAYLDGGNSGSDTASVTPANIDRFTLGVTGDSTPLWWLNGQIAEAAIWDIALSATEVASLADGVSPLLIRPGNLVNYWPLLGRYSPEIDRAGSNDLTVTGATQAAHPRIIYPKRRHVITAPVSGAYALTAAQGSYTLTGQTATLKADRTITAAQGAYTLTGQAAGLKVGYKLTAAQGSYTLSGQDVTLTYTPLGAYTLVAAQGSYTLTGQAAALTAARTITAVQGSYTLTGQAASLTTDRAITAALGSYTITGQAAGLKIARLLTAGAGIYVYTGQAAGLVYSAPVVYLAGVPSWDVPTRGIEWDVPDRPIIWDAPNRDD